MPRLLFMPLLGYRKDVVKKKNQKLKIYMFLQSEVKNTEFR